MAGLASGSLMVLSARGSSGSDPALVTHFRLVAATFDEAHWKETAIFYAINLLLLAAADVTGG